MKYVNGLTLEVTKKCNFECQYCFSSSNNKERDELPATLIMNLIDQFQKLENKIQYEKSKNRTRNIQVVITGGEFLLHPNWSVLIDYLSENSVPFDISTNGILLSKEIIDKFVDSSVNDFQISLDGLNPEDNYLRNPEKTNTIINNIRLAANSPLRERITIKATITKINQKSVFSLVPFCEELGLRLVLGYVQILGRAAENIEMALSTSEIVALNKTIINKYPSLSLPLMFSHTPCPLDIDNEPLSFRIAANGDIYPCASFHEPFFVIGNAYTTTLKDAIEGKRFKELQQWIASRKQRMSTHECKNCYVSSYCQGSCPAASYYECGDVYLPTTRLCMAAKQFNYFMVSKLSKSMHNSIN